MEQNESEIEMRKVTLKEQLEWQRDYAYRQMLLYQRLYLEALRELALLGEKKEEFFDEEELCR